MKRRPFLASITAATASGVAGCRGTASKPDGCPTSRGYDIERPENLTATTAKSFVERYERAYIRDMTFPAGAKDTITSPGEVDVTRHAGGYAVRITMDFGYCVASDQPTAETPRPDPTMVCADGRSSALYYVDGMVVRRTDRPTEETNPQNGGLLECE
ncbi:hypothetical protein [Haloarcula nitratireducens]|uniref:Lipoprotein n=1 Tax=Haloarcula nitratireducens TaxID=2487749 RepID=A0AAW4PEY5_9EURY|nr:hypothetical protein [Halomicroarcula nitratireducens]MBX0295827.1 hypothetical protein [Halomicroarcula nitratireducens]